jgi:hypothetical protein
VLSSTNSEKEVITRKEWDYLPHIDDLDTRESTKNIQQNNGDTKDKFLKSCHIARKLEREYLIDFFRRLKEDSLLISGKRGVSITIYGDERINISA